MHFNIVFLHDFSNGRDAFENSATLLQCMVWSLMLEVLLEFRSATASHGFLHAVADDVDFVPCIQCIL